MYVSIYKCLIVHFFSHETLYIIEIYFKISETYYAVTSTSSANMEGRYGAEVW